ncbi:MAG: 3-hydroxybutyryl-CoA dehydrogenase [Saprospiraceae bacterium]|nr:3-hydroxybutyryl-CoA dehydrogenase [Saprospiraceae bacterium]
MKKITVVGAGTMGNGIAHVFGLHDYQVNLVDLSAKQLERAMATISHNLNRMVEKKKITTDAKVKALVNIQTSTKLPPSIENADLVIEAVIENEPLKLKVFEDLNTYAPQTCILASNTSSISISKLASCVDARERVIGMHFMNPVPLMKLVEIVKGYDTSDGVCDAVERLTKVIGKVPVVVNDYPGFVSNRILMPMINEAIYTLYEGVAEVQGIDQIMRLGLAHPMGPLQLADFIGLDVCLSILDVLYEGFGHSKYAPCPLLVNMVHAGRLGRKSGEGFYQYGQGKTAVSDNFQ